MTTDVLNLTDLALVTEDELLDRARDGDKSAFGALYLRHKDAARRVATMCTSSRADAEDAVAEGFAKVFAALPRMQGRTISFRPYLLTCVRNAATDRLRREKRIDLREAMPETPGDLQADDGALLGLERNLVGEALQALPSRWRTVLWLTEVEGLSPAEVSQRIGIKPNAVAALAYRARKGLREAYLQAHLKAEASTECRSTVSRLGNYVRADLPEKERLAVQAHLDECGKCRGRRDELTDVNATLRNALLPVPLLLGGLQRRWFDFFSGTQLAAKAPELAHLAQLAEPGGNKALAGLTIAVLALTGAAVPGVMKARDDARSQGPVPAAAAPAASTVRSAAPIASSHLPATPAPAALTAPAAPAKGTVSASGGSAPAGSTQSKLFKVGDSDGGAAGGGTRHRLLTPGHDDSNGGLIGPSPIAPVGAVVESAVDSLQLGGLLPITVSSTGNSSVLSIGSAALGFALNLDPVAGLQIGAVEAPATADPAAPLLELGGLGLQVDVAGGILTDVVDSVVVPLVQPVTGLLGNVR